MFKQKIKWAINKLGYEIKKISTGVTVKNHFQIYEYLNKDGSFDYETYKKVQIQGNKKKIDAVWVIEENIAFLSEYIKNNFDELHFGICHGTRRGKEQEWFRKYLKCNIIGTEISDTAQKFPHTIQWDFHETKPEWLGKTDFIYSNSLDHSYDPEKCLNAWIRCLKEGGICILEHTSSQEKARQMDPFGAHISHMPYLILKWGKGNFYVKDILQAPSKRGYLKYCDFIIIQKNRND